MPAFNSGLLHRFLATLFLCSFCLLARAQTVSLSGVYPYDTTFSFTYDGIDYEGYLGYYENGPVASINVVGGNFEGDISFPDYFRLQASNPQYDPYNNPDVPQNLWVTTRVMFGPECNLSGNPMITSIKLPAGVYYDFPLSLEDCPNLRSATVTVCNSSRMPSFSNCTSLTTVVVETNKPEYSDEPFRYYGGDFEGCTSLETIEYPEGLAETGNFKGCTSLSHISFPNSLSSIDLNAFENCTALEYIGLPPSVRDITLFGYNSSNEFFDPTYNNPLFTGFTFPNGSGTYEQINGALIKNGGTLVRVFPHASHELVRCEPYGSLNGFYYKIPDKVTDIADRAMMKVPFSNVWFGDRVTSIGWLAYEPTREIGSIILGRNVAVLKFPCFSMPRELIFLSAVPPVSKDSYGNTTNQIFNGFVNYVNPKALEAYKACDETGSQDIRPIDWWTDLSCVYRIDHQTGTAAVESVKYPWDKDEISFHESVNLLGTEYPVTSLKTYLNAKSVRLNKNFENVESGGSIETISVDPENKYFRSFDGVLYRVGEGTFDTPESLHLWPSLKGGDCVIREGTRFACLDGATQITSLDIPASLDSISAGSGFCEKIELINFPSLEKWFSIKGKNPAYNPYPGIIPKIKYTCNHKPIERVIIPAGDDMIPGLFHGCSTLIEATYDFSGTGGRLVEGAFSACSNLKSVTLGEGIEEIGNYAFKNCTSLESMKLPHSVARLGKEAFYGDTSLTELSLSPRLKKLEGNTAALCKNLRHFIIPEGVDSLGRWEIWGTDMKLELISLPSTLKTLGESNGSGYPTFSRIKEGVVIYCWASEPPEASYENLAGVSLHVPVGTSSLYSAATGWSSADEIIDDLLVDTSSEPSEKSITINVPASPGHEALETARYEVDLYILSDDGTRTFVRRYEFDAVGIPMSRAANGVSLTIDGLSGNTNYYYELRGYTASNDLVVARTGEAATRIATGLDSVDSDSQPVYRDGKLRLPAKNTRVVIYSLDGRAVLNTVCDDKEIDLRSQLSPGLYIYSTGNLTGKIKID